MNAGAHGAAICDRLESITSWRGGGKVVTKKSDLEYGYRYLKLKSAEVVLGATFSLSTADRDAIKARVAELLAHRRETQKVARPNAGSFFKNPDGEQAWRLIDRAGLRGFSVGGAAVAEEHCNFFVNRGGAMAGDFLELADLVKNRVRQVTGITLQEEVRIVGEDAAKQRGEVEP
jgi:UDP-N-acetylmuramate dehydrogenase